MNPDPRRHEFRAWVRAHHPDAGGDPAQFVAGLRRWRPDLDPDPATATPATEVFRTRGGLWRLARWWERQRRGPRVR